MDPNLFHVILNLFFFFIVPLAFIIRTVRNTFYHVFLWQLKEYRADRMVIHLKTWQGRRWMFGLLSSLKLLTLLVGISYFIFFPHITRDIDDILFPLIFFLPALIYCFEGIQNGLELIKRGWRRPVWTVKSITVVFLAFVFTVVMVSGSWSYEDYPMYVFFLIPDKTLGLFIGILFLIFSIPTKIQRRFVIQKAKRKMQERRDLIVIGITGSYGKTSTKEYLTQILSQKYKVLKTEKSNNTDIGIAQVIVGKLKPEHQIFVVEMGAYKRGEIKLICEIVKPKIGIITAINEQHLDLFGSIENTMKAKYELIESLPADGVAVFNAENVFTKELAQKTKKATQLYAVGPARHGIRVWANNIDVHLDALDFTLGIGKQSIRCSAPLIGKQHIENILAAVTVASELGMNLDQIKQGISALVSPPMTMNLIRHKSGAYLVDDTFNANPVAALATLNYLSVHKKKRVLVLQPMIELGDGAHIGHEQVGKKASEICDLVILTNNNFNQWFMNGVDKGNRDVEVKVAGGEPAVTLLSSYLKEDNAIVFEGKEAGKILEKMT